MNLESFTILNSINKRQELIDKAEKIITELTKIFEIQNDDKVKKEITCYNRDINEYYTRITYDIKFESKREIIKFKLHVIPDLDTIDYINKEDEKIVSAETTAVSIFLKKPTYSAYVREDREDDGRWCDVIEYNNEIFLTNVYLYDYN